MTNLGIGVMLNMLGGNRETVDAFKGAIGKEIASLKVHENDNRWEASSALRITFSDDSGIEFYDDGQSCCENRYMHTDDKLDDFVGANLLDAELRDGPAENSEYDYLKESQFLIITTSIGQFTVVNYNEHNGYYGGFALAVREI